MIGRSSRLRWRRTLKRSKRQVEDLGYQAEEQLERHFFRRLGRLTQVTRFTVSWLMLLVLLSVIMFSQIRGLGNYYLQLEPAAGGIFTEGILGSFTNANPIFASGSVNSSVSRLMYPGLLKFDQKNRLVGDLAAQWNVDKTGKVYTVVLRNNVLWQDGTPVTADDVVFTYKTIQNPDAKSPLQSSWAGIKVAKVSDATVMFTLPNVLSSFPYGLTNGIAPKHILSNVDVADLRSSSYNTVQAVASGPFVLENILVEGGTPETREEQIILTANPTYHGTRPKLERYIVRTYREEKTLLAAFEDNKLNAISGVEMLPDTLANQSDVKALDIPITGQTMVFFKNSHEILKDVAVRQALVYGADRGEIVSNLGFTAKISRGPLLTTHVGYDKKFDQPNQNIKKASQLLDKAGWKQENGTGIRKKAGKELRFRLFSQSTSEYLNVTQRLKEQWEKIGVALDVTLQESSELQATIGQHTYDALLYGISVGSDPDVFPYWHSSQASPRLASRFNFSEYSSATADSSLEAGRTRSEPKLRAIKYRPFMAAWQKDAPALALYQPRYLFITRGDIYQFETELVNVAADRYANVQNWMIRQIKASKTD